MAENKTFFIGAELFLNIVCPAAFVYMYFDRLIVPAYASSVIFLFLVLAYIRYKKHVYFKKFLSRTYVPSFNLIVTTQSINLVLLLVLYTLIFKDRLGWTWWVLIPVVHLLLTLGTCLLLLYQKQKNKAMIAYTRHEYKLGIMGRDVGGPNGLRRGQPVEIIQEVPDGYIVKDSLKHEYHVDREDIESIIDVI